MATYTDPLVTLYVRDVEGMARFYRERFGLEETFRTPATGTAIHIELRTAGLLLGFSDIDTAERLYGVRPGDGTPRFELVFWTEDVDASWEDLLTHGCGEVTPPHTFNDGRLRAALLSDPEGNFVKVVMSLRQPN